MESIGYPVKATAQADERLSRLLIFIKWFLAIPHFIVIYILMLVEMLFLLFAWFAILFTGRFPRSLFTFNEGVFRWMWRLNMYLLLQTDKYPPFSLEKDDSYPATLEIAYPERLSRLLIFFKFLLAIPHFLVIWVLQIAMCFVLVASWFIILFTGKIPQSMSHFIIGVSKWYIRVHAYLFLMTDVYPPFSFED